MADLSNPIVETQDLLRRGTEALSQRMRSDRVRRESGSRAMLRPGILVVEDDVNTARTLWRSLQAHQLIDVSVANTLGAARRCASRDVPWDVIVVDLNMGGGERGEELVHELLVSGGAKQIVVSTGLERRDAVERLGADASSVLIREKADGDITAWLVDMATDLAKQRLAR